MRSSTSLRPTDDRVGLLDSDSWEDLWRKWLHRWRSSEKEWIQRLAEWREALSSEDKKRAVGAFSLSALILLGSYRRRSRARTYRSAKEAPLSLLYQASRDGLLERALLGSSTVFYLLNGDWKRSVLPPSLAQKDLVEKLSSTCNDVSALPESLASQLATPVLASLPFLYLYFVYRMLSKTTGGDSMRDFLHSRSSTTFQDVAGLDDVVTDVAEVVTYLKDPTKYQRVGARPPRAVLLYGPPGSGKTLLAQAVAGEANVDCFLACSASDFVEVYVGRGAARVRSLFAQARQQAKQQSWLGRLLWNRSSGNKSTVKHSAILFIDELDALAKTRMSFGSNDEREQTLNQLLVELDGFSSDIDDDVTLTVIAASNRVDVLDPAVLRRFDRQIRVGYPDANGRKEILKVHARRIACDEIDWDRIASELRTGGFSGADLRNVINDAALLAVRDGKALVQQSHVEHAARRVNQMKWKQSFDVTKRHELGIR